MTKAQFDDAITEVDKKLGSPRMTWTGPEPHDFRNMRERGVRFVHSDLMAKLPEWLVPGDADYAPDGKMHFKILVGDDAAEAEIIQRIESAGFVWELDEKGSCFHVLTFSVEC